MPRLLRNLIDRIWFRHGFIATAASVVGIAGGLNSLFGGSGTTAPNPNQYMYANPQQQAQASTSWLDAFNTQKGLESQLSGAVANPVLSALTGAVNTPNPNLAGLPPQLQRAYGNMGSADQLYAQLLGRTGANALTTLPDAGLATYLTSLDPQNVLHDRLLHGVQEQSNAGQSQRGIAIGGMGQGLTDEAGTNFEMDWSNNLLGRQIQGLTALEKATNTGAQAGVNSLDASQNFYGMVPGALTGGATAPWAPATLQGSYLSSILSALGGGMQQYGINPLVQTQNQAIPFLNQGAGAGANAFTGALNSFNANTDMAATGMESLLTGMKNFPTGGVSSWLNSMGGGGGANADAYTNMAAQAPPVPSGNYSYT